MKKIKLHERLRLFIQCLSFVFHNGYVRGWAKGTIYSGSNKAFCVPGLNCYSCPGAVGACPIGSLQAVLDGGNFRLSLYVFGFIAAIGVFCGRFVCGWLCPFGLVQDLLHRIPLFRKKKNLPGHKKLCWLRYLILVMFVIVLPLTVMNAAGIGKPWFCEYICPSGTLLGGIPLVLSNASLRANVGWRFAWKVALLLAVLVLSIKFYRPFCKYVCPLGALYGLANPISIYRLKCDEDTCVKCGACQRACGMDIPVWEKPNSLDCIRCGKCMAACPTGALTSTFRRKKNSDAAGETDGPGYVISGEAAAAGIRSTAAPAHEAAAVSITQMAADRTAAAAGKAESNGTASFEAANSAETVMLKQGTASVTAYVPGEAGASDEAEAPIEAADSGTAQTPQSNENTLNIENAGKIRKIRKAGTGALPVSLLCLAAAGYTFYAALKTPILLLIYEPVGSLTDMLVNHVCGFALLVPAVMLVILAVQLLRFRRQSELLRQLAPWRAGLLKTILWSVVIGILLYFVSLMMYAGFNPVLLLIAVSSYISNTYLALALMAAAALLTQLPLPGIRHRHSGRGRRRAA